MATQAQEEPAYSFSLTAASRARQPVRYTAFWALTLLISDVTLFVLAAYIAGSIVDRNWGIHVASVRFWNSSVIFVGFWTVMFYALGLYQRSLALSFKDEFYFTIIALVFGVTPQLLLFSLLPSLSTSRMVLLLSTSMAVALVGTSRSIAHVMRAAADRRRPRRILIVGQLDQVNAARETLRQPSVDLITLTLEPDFADGRELGGCVDDIAFWLETAVKSRCDQIVLTDLKDNKSIRQLLVMCETSAIKVSLTLPSVHLGVYGLELERKGNQDLLVPVCPRICRPTARLVKRIFDLLFASLGILISLPIMIAAGLAVWAESGRPILFRQERVGRQGRVFKIMKFRTMLTNADATWATLGDARITRVGAVLRRTSVDELPQLFNVLSGQMSLVGPRPEMRSFEESFASRIPLYAERRLAPPGITGWAQVNMKRNLSPDDVDQVLTNDLFYIERWSVFLDLTVLLKTAAEFLFHRAV
jgi:exopolysaccharide biosynthesis polyprenyl glycosylphosphotransferase